MKNNYPSQATALLAVTAGLPGKASKATIKIFVAFFVLMMSFLGQGNLLAQPGAMSINQDVSGTYTNSGTFLMGGVFQFRVKENASGTASGTRNWQFNADGYFNTWGVKSTNGASSVVLGAYNTVIAPNAASASANWEAGAGYNSKGRLPATTANYYYTYNIVKGTSYADQLMAVLETSTDPVSFFATHTAGTYGSRAVSITTSATPAAGENIFVRYSTNSFTSSTLVQATGSGTAWSATIPWQSSDVFFYVYSSNKTLAAINSEVALFGQGAHDVNMLNLYNNSGFNFFWTPPTGSIIVTSTGGTLANTPTAYPTFTVAAGVFADLNAGVKFTGTVTVLITANVTTETGAIALNSSALWTSLGIQPNGVRTISGTTSTPLQLIDLNGADNVTINGLNSGGNSLTISNLSTSAVSGTSTIRFIGGATNNTITNCSVFGSSTMSVITNGGNIYFATDAATANGNDNNTISNCNIGPAGANLPTKCIYMNGSTTTTAIGNSGNTFNNNNIFDYFSATVSSAGIYIGNGNTDNNITNNKFYQGATRTQTTASQHSAIWIANASGNNFAVTGNTIGFGTSGGLGIYVFGGISGSVFIPIYLNVGSTTATSIQNNTIASIVMSGSSSGTATSSPLRCIFINEGLVNVGNTNGNTIGSLSSGSIAFSSTSSSASDIHAIYNFSSFNTNISNNNIGGISVANSSTGSVGFYGIRVNTGSGVTSTITGNTIGGTVPGSILNSSTATGNIVQGILMTTSLATLSSNTIRNITSSGGTGTGTAPALGGIVFAGTTVNNTVSQNTIHSLSLSTAGHVTGIMYTSSTGTNLISRNNIHSLNATNTGAVINGIFINAGTATYQNNMIRLGVDASGNSITTACAINGINETVAGTDNFYFNSVYIGGTGVGTTASNTFAFQSNITTNTRNYQDNIFANVRSNATTGGKHYAIRVGGTAANPAGLTCNYNDLYVSGTGTVLGLFNSVDRTDIATWRTATGQDVNSINSDPSFVTPNGTSSTVDLHVSNTSPVDAVGIAIAGVTDDFDGQTRSTLTPTDIGADAFLGALCSVASGGTISPATASKCVGQTYTISSTGATSGNGISYIWQVSTTSGSGYADISGATNTSYTTPALTAGAFYYVLKTTCSNGPITGLSNELTLTVNALPAVAVSPTSASYCTPGGPAVALTASGASTYTWSPATGLTPTTGASVSATPSTSTTYTVTGTDGNGCVNTATAAITTGNSVTVSASATPPSVCSGSNSQLLATASQPFTTSLAAAYAFTGATGTYATITGTTLGAGAIGDDVGIGNLPIGFTFNYNGSDHTIFGARSNGLIELSQATGSLSGFSLNALASTANCIAPLWDDNNTTAAP